MSKKRNPIEELIQFDVKLSKLKDESDDDEISDESDNERNNEDKESSDESDNERNNEDKESSDDSDDERNNDDKESDDERNNDDSDDDKDDDKDDEVKKFIQCKMNIKNSMQKMEGIGEFVVYGGTDSATLSNPGIYIDGIPYTFPLSESQIENITKSCSNAPFGKGEMTVLDENVRKTLQVHPHQIVFTNPNYELAIKKIAQKASCLLGIQENSYVKAHFHKMLLYRPGDFFKKHRDGVHEHGMFGTLIVQLPSVYTGGSLEVQHLSSTKVVDMSLNETSKFEAQFCALYADCQHEVHPLTSGTRVVLTYNLVMNTSSVSIPSFPSDHSESLQKLSQNLKECFSNGRNILGFPLSHLYPQHMSTLEKVSLEHISHLKGSDRYRAYALQNVSKELGLSVRLGTLIRSVYLPHDQDDEKHDVSFTLQIASDCSKELSKDDLVFVDWNVSKGSNADDHDDDDFLFKNHKIYERLASEHVGNEPASGERRYSFFCLYLIPDEKIVKFLFTETKSFIQADTFVKLLENSDEKICEDVIQYCGNIGNVGYTIDIANAVFSANIKDDVFEKLLQTNPSLMTLAYITDFNMMPLSRRKYAMEAFTSKTELFPMFSQHGMEMMIEQHYSYTSISDLYFRFEKHLQEACCKSYLMLGNGDWYNQQFDIATDYAKSTIAKCVILQNFPCKDTIRFYPIRSVDLDETYNRIKNQEGVLEWLTKQFENGSIESKLIVSKIALIHHLELSETILCYVVTAVEKESSERHEILSLLQKESYGRTSKTLVLDAVDALLRRSMPGDPLFKNSCTAFGHLSSVMDKESLKILADNLFDVWEKNTSLISFAYRAFIDERIAKKETDFHRKIHEKFFCDDVSFHINGEYYSDLPSNQREKIYCFLCSKYEYQEMDLEMKNVIEKVVLNAREYFTFEVCDDPLKIHIKKTRSAFLKMKKDVFHYDLIRHSIDELKAKAANRLENIAL